jgi:hypothetical protein
MSSQRRKPGPEDVTPEQQASLVYLGNMMAGGDDKSGILEDFDRQGQESLNQLHEAKEKKMRAAMRGEDQNTDPGQFDT